MKPIEIKYRIDGMDCAGCGQTIEKFCAKIPEVQKAQVNYMAATLHLECLSEEAQEKVEIGIEKIGFSLKKIGQEKPFQLKKQIHQNFRKKFRHLHKLPAYPFQKKPEQQEKHSFFLQKELLHIYGLMFIYLFFWGVEFFSPFVSSLLFDGLSLFCLWPIGKKVIEYFKVKFFFSVEFLMSVAVIGALFLRASKEAAAVMILFLIGEALESYTSKRASKGIEKLASLVPEKATLIVQKNSFKTIPTSQIQINHVLLIKPGERFPTDGILLAGETTTDESLLTGEATPIYKKLNDTVHAGSLNLDGSVEIQCTQNGKNNSLFQLIQLVQEAQGSKSKTMRTIEQFSQYYTPIIFLLGLTTALFPYLSNQLSWHESIYRGLSVLLIGCPCALIISTPSAIAAGISTAAKFGVLIKHAAALEIIGKVKTIAFDKTGTLTEGILSGKKFVTLVRDYSNEEILQIAGSIEQFSTHPLARSILKYAKENQIMLLPFNDGKTLSGIGASALWQNDEFLICSSQWFLLQQKNTSLPLNIKELQDQGQTVCLVLKNKFPIGFISLQDQLRPSAKETIDQLKKLGITPVILTGDHTRSAQVMTGNLDIKIIAELTPQQKLSYIRQYSEIGKVAMIGDGINDGPALAAADVAVSISEGTDVAIDSSQIIIANKNLLSLIFAVATSRKTHHFIAQNIFVALFLKVIFLILVYTNHSSLWMAILADTGATVLVTLNSMRLLFFRPIESKN